VTTTATTPGTTSQPRRPRRGTGRTVVGVVLTAVMLFPVYWMVNVSLTPENRMRKSPPDLFPLHPSLEGYRTVIADQGPYLATSLGIALATVVLTLVISAPAGFALAKLRPRGGGALTFVVLISQMIPGVIMAMGFYAFFLSIGLLDNPVGLVIADSTIAVPFGVLIFAAFMSGVPDEILQAATMDGASTFRTFRSIVLPVSRNAAVTVALFTFLWAWSDFLYANTLARSSNYQPITLGIYKYIGNNSSDWNAILATAVVASIPAAVLLVAAQRYVSAGVTAGAVKD
jgi:multiple sugar transport system permease protein